MAEKSSTDHTARHVPRKTALDLHLLPGARLDMAFRRRLRGDAIP